MNREDELRRLDTHPDGSEVAPGLGLVRFLARSDNATAARSLDRAKEVMHATLSVPDDSWKDLTMVATRFPTWYVRAFREEATPDEDERWLARWRKASRSEQHQLEEERGWTFGAWCYWMEPEHRSWYWWRAQVIKPDKATVEVSVDEWPFPSGSLRMVLRLSGFSAVDEDG